MLVTLMHAWFACLIFFQSDSDSLKEKLKEAGYQKNITLISEIGGQLLRTATDSSKIANAYAQLGNAYYTARQMDSALQYQKKASYMYEQLHNIASAAYSFMTMSRFFYENLQLDEAALAAHKSLELYQKINDAGNIARSLSALANLNAALNHRQEAYQYSRKAIHVASTSALEVEQAESWMTLAKIHNQYQQPDSALLYSRRALALFLKTKEPLGIGTAHRVVAESYFNLNQQTQALQQAALAERDLIQVGFENEMPDLYLLKAKIYRKQNKKDSARFYFERAAESAANHYLFNKEMEAHRASFQLAYEMGEHQSALNHLVRYNHLKDSAYTLEQTRAVERFRAQYSLREKQREIELLEATTQVKDAQIKQAKTFNWLLIVLLALSSVIGYTIYKWVINRNKARFAQEREKLQKMRFSAVLTAEEAQREKISRELHDGVGQLVSIVRLGLSGEGESTIIKKNIAILDQAVDELRAISHNLMPQPLVKKGLFMALRSLANNVQQAGIQVNFQCPEAELPVEASRKISIYRIVQEITNNALKYSEAKTLNINIGVNNQILSIEITDDGKGFDTNVISKSSGIGWDNIYTRLDVLGGVMKLESAPGKGSKFYINIPVSTTQEN